MQNWWELVGQTSVLAGLGLGLVWAVFSMLRRRSSFQRAGMRPSGEMPWFIVSFVSMSSYLTLVLTVGLLAAHGAIERELAWFLVSASVISFCAALWFSNFSQPPATSHDQRSLASANVEPLRRTA